MANCLRYRGARDEADRLGQVFTPESIANLLVETMPTPSKGIRQIIDLGAGEGALTRAALKRFPRSKALLVETDSFYASALLTTMPKCVSVIHGDALETGWEAGLNAGILLSNPPYGTLPLSESISNMLAKTNLPVPTNGDWVRGDAAFVARAWMCASKGTSLGLIVASPLIRDHSFRQLREVLISQIHGLCVTQLDTRVFHDAEVQAFLITGMKSPKRKRKVILRKASLDGRIVDELEIGWNAAINRLDFDYYNTMRQLGASSTLTEETLASIGASIVRGSRSHNDFEELGLNAFHTTDFKGFSGELALNDFHADFKTARPGDILIPRVGTRCLQNQAKIVKGEGLFTDCVYRLCVKQEAREKVWKTLSSSFGSEWRLANASGNCAKHLTVQTLLGMPLIA